MLRLCNLLQFLPRALWTTTKGVERDLYGELAAAFGGETPDLDVPDDLDDAWQESLALALAEFRPVMRAVAAAGAPAPEVGFEIIDGDENGQGVLAQAELAWPDTRIAAGVSGDDATAFGTAGWRVLPMDTAALIAALCGEDKA